MSRIAFASCNGQDVPNKLWPIIESREPAALVWGGDAIYADFTTGTNWNTFPPQKIREPANPARLEKLYQKQLRHAGYRSLLQTNITVFGTLDDHDFGIDNGDKTYRYAMEAGVAFVKFTNEPVDFPTAKRAYRGEGVYGVKLFDFSRPTPFVPDLEAALDSDLPEQPWSYTNKTVAVFVLDVRTNKTPWKPGIEAFKADYEGDFLGERQWQWFDRSLRRSKASVNIVVNGVQVHGTRSPDANLAEDWNKYPRAQQRLFDTILESGAEAPILISGDVHMAQLMRRDCQYVGEDRTTKPRHRRTLVEVTTSGMTHSWGSIMTPTPKQHEPSLVNSYKFFISRTFMRWMHAVCPWTDIMVADDLGDAESVENGGFEGAKRGLQFALDKNFGELEFDWQSRTVISRILGEDTTKSPPLLGARWSMDQLSGRAQFPGGMTDFVPREDGVHRTWQCENHRGVPSQFKITFGHVASLLALFVLFGLPYIAPFLMLHLVSRKMQTSLKGIQGGASKRSTS